MAARILTSTRPRPLEASLVAGMLGMVAKILTNTRPHPLEASLVAGTLGMVSRILTSTRPRPLEDTHEYTPSSSTGQSSGWYAGDGC